jgi:7-carboxy-7-deazaguanine synthase
VLTVNEIFHSIQGESTHAGRRCVFVRLTACDLRCTWCDTPYAFHEGRKMSLDEIVEEIERYACDTVELTGGEPLLQKNVYPLIDRLLEQGKLVLIETGGHISLEHVPAPVRTIMDVKCPGSGEAGTTDWTNLERLDDNDEVKFVIRDREDYEYARDVLERHRLAGRVAAVLFSPVHGVLDPKTLSEWVLADRLPVRVQLQVHKYIWSPDTRGV